MVQNEKNSGRYRMLASAGALAGVRGVVRNADDRLRAAAIERLLCDGSVDAAAIPGAWPALKALESRGLIALDGTRITILPEGRPYARLVAAAFDAWRMTPTQAFSKAV